MASAPESDSGSGSGSTVSWPLLALDAPTPLRPVARGDGHEGRGFVGYVVDLEVSGP